MTTTDGGPVVKVARDLREILRLYGELEEQAVADANSRLMPGGAAMHQLGPVANIEAWANLVDAGEVLGRAYTSAEDEDPDEGWPAYQTIEFWSESWRRERGDDYDMRRTIATEANYLREMLEWAWDNELHWDEFAGDIERAKAKLENVVSAGSRPAFVGIPCMYEECRGTSLIRTTVPGRGKGGEKVWRLTDWHCPRCKRQWSEKDYSRNVYATLAARKYVNLGGDTWCTIDQAAERISRPPGTIWSWISRVQVAAVCVIEDQRTFALVADVHDRHQLANERAERRRAAIAAKRLTSV